MGTVARSPLLLRCVRRLGVELNCDPVRWLSCLIAWTALGNRFSIGEPIPRRLELVNQSRLELTYDDQQVGVNDSLRVTDRQGREIHAAQTTQTGGGWVKLRPGETAVLFDRLDITKQYAIRQPGHYGVQFRGRGLSVGVENPDLKHQSSKIVGIPCQWPSNVVTIEVTR